MHAPALPGRRGWTVGVLLREALSFVQPRLPAWQHKILRALAACRTPALGGHRYRCAHCYREHFVAHACRNRHCPDCQPAAAADWLEAQAACLLPIPYFHLVFTLPHDLNPLIQQNQRSLLNLFFATVSATLLEFGHNRFGAQLGLTLVLHTWGQTLIDHYHLHVLVTGGGLSPDRTAWIPASPYYLFPVQALSRVFCAKFCAGLQALYAAGKLRFHGQLQPLAEPARFQRLVRQATRHAWNVYAKRPFAGPGPVLKYLSRYTHRVAITSRRLLNCDLQAHTLTFLYKDYTDQERLKPMALSWREFLRRFCLHLLPNRFVKIRHYGFLSNRLRHRCVDQARQLLGAASTSSEALPESNSLDLHPEPAPLRCPYCGHPALELVEIVAPTFTVPPEDTS